jgi:hypothetical protein
MIISPNLKPSVPFCTLRAIPGYKENQELLQQYVTISWLAAYTILWNGKKFSGRELKHALQEIRSFLVNATDLNSGFTELVQRLVLGRQQLKTDYGRTRILPSVWFSDLYAEGFTATKAPYDLLQKRRAKLPLHRIGLRSLADAFLEMYDDPSPKNYHYWRSWFQQRNSNRLLNILLAFIANRGNN